MELIALTFKEKEQLLRHIAKLYRKGTMSKEMCFHGMIMESSGTYADIEIASQVDLILKHMEEPYALIIRNDFLNISQKEWWKKYYSSSTYYRYKNHAMDAFLDCLYM